MVEATKLKWQKDLIKECECEEVAKKVVSTEEKWRGTLISELGQDGLWKVDLILAAIDMEQAKLVADSEDQEEVAAISRVTVETHWKLKLYSALPHKLPWMVRLVDTCQSEDLAMILPRCGKQWQQQLVATSPCMEVWRADCLAGCSQRWQGHLVMASTWEAQARAVAMVKNEWQGAAITRVTPEQEWKLGVVANTDWEWQVEFIMKEDRQKVAKLICQLEQQSKVEKLVGCKVLEEWKVLLLGKELEDWKFDMILETEQEEQAMHIERCRSVTIGRLLLAAKESWRLNAIMEAFAGGGFWLAEVVGKCGEEWQARLALNGCRDKIEQWRLEQIPEITQEDITANFLFNARWNSSIPRWKFQLGLQLARAEDPLAQEKAELMFRDGLPKWKVEMAASCSEGWRLEHLARVAGRAVGELFMAAKEEWKAALLSEEKEEWRAELLAPVEEDWKALLMLRHVKRDERWRVKLVAPLKAEWQVKMVLFAPEVWKAEMIASLKPDQEMRARELLECSTKNFADEVAAGLTDIYYA